MVEGLIVTVCLFCFSLFIVWSVKITKDEKMGGDKQTPYKCLNCGNKNKDDFVVMYEAVSILDSFCLSYYSNNKNYEDFLNEMFKRLEYEMFDKIGLLNMEKYYYVYKIRASDFSYINLRFSIQAIKYK